MDRNEMEWRVLEMMCEVDRKGDRRWVRRLFF